MEQTLNLSKRLKHEMTSLTTNPRVQSYFQFESIEPGTDPNTFYIYGYLLPRIEPYKSGSFKVLITITSTFPFQPPNMNFLTKIYHPAIYDDVSKSEFHGGRCKTTWNPTTRIIDWLEQNVNIIDRPEDIQAYCLKNEQAKKLYDENKVEYNKKVLVMIEKYSNLRSKQSFISLKYAAKQFIRRQLDFDSAKINQLPLSTNLKHYLDPPLKAN